MSVLDVAHQDGIAVLHLNRPERRNALSGELVAALLDALRAADRDAAVRVVVLAGRGAGFCSGGDLAGGFGAGDGIVATERERGRFAELMGLIPSLSVPVIAAVHGDAMGGGLGLVAACDLAVLDPEARLGTPEIKVGLFPYVITAPLQRNVPRKALFELMMTGGRVSAARAVELGLANRVSAPGAAFDEAMALAGEIASKSKAIVSMGKRAFYAAADLAYGPALTHLDSRLTVNLLTEDAMEGIAAFMGRRPPEWKDR